MNMSSINISIKKEAYDYLKSIKKEDESFSDAILKLKEEQKKDGLLVAELAEKYGTEDVDEYYFKERQQSFKEFRQEFERNLKK